MKVFGAPCFQLELNSEGGVMSLTLSLTRSLSLAHILTHLSAHITSALTCVKDRRNLSGLDFHYSFHSQ